jgi:hypothetical protein
MWSYSQYILRQQRQQAEMKRRDEIRAWALLLAQAQAHHAQVTDDLEHDGLREDNLYRDDEECS